MEKLSKQIPISHRNKMYGSYINYGLQNEMSFEKYCQVYFTYFEPILKK